MKSVRPNTNQRLKAMLKTMAVADIVDLFRDYALQQDEAMLCGEQANVNKLFWKLAAITDELKSRPGDQRTVLLRLYDHPNPQVRVKAIKAALAVAPEAGRRALEALANSNEFPAAGEAGMSIVALDRGIFRPT